MDEMTGQDAEVSSAESELSGTLPVEGAAGDADSSCQNLVDENCNLFLSPSNIPSVEDCLSFYLGENATIDGLLRKETTSFLKGTSRIRGGNNERRFICSLCDKAFTLKQHLECHMVIHTGERPFVCGICKASFSLRQHLTQHMPTHSDEQTAKKHCCNICGKSFLQGFNLTRHLRVHSGEKRFICFICDKGFANGWSLQNHLMIHSSDKPYNCEVCEKDFRKKCHLKRHMKTHSSDRRSRKGRRKSVASPKDDLVCDNCEERCPNNAKLKNHDCDFKVSDYQEKRIKKTRTAVASDDEETNSSPDADYIEIKVEQE